MRVFLGCFPRIRYYMELALAIRSYEDIFSTQYAANLERRLSHARRPVNIKGRFRGCDLRSAPYVARRGIPGRSAPEHGRASTPPTQLSYCVAYCVLKLSSFVAGLRARSRERHF